MAEGFDPAGNPSDQVQVGKSGGDEYEKSDSDSGGKKTKADLLAEAQEKGLDVSDSSTKAEIQAALDDASE